MDMTAQRTTYRRFLRLVTWLGVGSVAMLAALALFLL